MRAHFIPLGQAALELLEATSPESPIAKYLERRGPGLHHITLRVDDIDAALAAAARPRRPARRRASAAWRRRCVDRVHSSVGRARRARGAEAGGPAPAQARDAADGVGEPRAS